MNRILVIRGGAIGDFILTLPAIKLLRDRFPKAHLEILGYPQIICLAENQSYADAIRSIESGTLAAFFADGAVLPAELARYFGDFDLIVSYLYDPDRIFENNLKRCGIQMFLTGPSKMGGHEHAAFQLARPLEQIGLRLQDPAARICSIERDREFVRSQLVEDSKPVVAIHPGSGSETKNWPIERWKEVGEHILSADDGVIVIGGEADEDRVHFLEAAWENKPVRFARNLALPQLAALFGMISLFVGHDSGISHLAAAAGAQSVLLFGRTDPAIWAPANEGVAVLRATEGNLHLLSVDQVIAALRAQSLVR